MFVEKEEGKVEAILTGSGVAFSFGTLSVKWAMKLGYSQFIQIILFFTALLFGPLVLFTLYIRLLYLRKKMGESGTQHFGYPKESVAN